jgi:hypothetical protein
MKNPCAKFARWRTYALTSRDAPLKKLSVEAFGSKFLLKINGEPRTVLETIEMQRGAPALVLGRQYDMCPAQQQFWMEAVVSEHVARRPGVSSSSFSFSFTSLICVTGPALSKAAH